MNFTENKKNGDVYAATDLFLISFSSVIPLFLISLVAPDPVSIPILLSFIPYFCYRSHHSFTADPNSFTDVFSSY